MATSPYSSFLDVVAACDDFPYGSAADAYYKLYLPDDDQPHGYMLPEIVQKMPWTSCFHIEHEIPRKVIVLDKSEGAGTAIAINTAFQGIIDLCIERDLFHVLCAKHSERFAIPGARYDAPVWIERFATSLFGLTTRGAHMIAYTNTAKGLKVWVSRRAPNLYTWPGMLDSTVGGGVKAGVPPLQTILEEAEEEASLPQAFVKANAKSRGALSHMGVTGATFPGEKGLVTPDYVWLYDIELPKDVVPTPHDDEVSAFYCMTVDELKKALLNREFKPDSGAVWVEFLMRHGMITPENEDNFLDITMRLHRRLPFRIQ